MRHSPRFIEKKRTAHCASAIRSKRKTNRAIVNKAQLDDKVKFYGDLARKKEGGKIAIGGSAPKSTTIAA